MVSSTVSCSRLSESKIKNYRTPLIVVGVACLLLLVFSRSPDELLTARFFAEDGQVFYQQAHELGFLHSVLATYNGYLHLFPRLIAGISLWLPLYYVPLFFNVAALTIQCVTAIYICSARMRNAGVLPLRIVVALLYLGLPHTGEVWGKLVNSQWQLAVLSFLILIAEPPRSRAGSWFDLAALAMSALTGPFSVLLFPIALLVALHKRSRRTVMQLALTAAGAVVQGVLLLTNGRSPGASTLGATVPLFCRILVRWLLFGFLPFRHRLELFVQSLIGSWIFAGCLLIVVLAFAMWSARRGSFELRCVLLFGVVVIAASLTSPVAASGGEQWPSLLEGGGERYWFIPRLVLAVEVLWLVVQPFSRWARAAGVAIMVAIGICCAAGWHIAQWQGPHFRTYLHVFDALPVGARLNVPIEPPPNWTLQLTKKPFDPMSHDAGFRDGRVLSDHDWRQELAFTTDDAGAASLLCDVIAVNGSSVAGRGTVTAPVHATILDGALLEGWAVLNGDHEPIAMDRIYAKVYDRVVEGDRLSLPFFYRKKPMYDAPYLVFLPPTVLRPGLQAVTVMGYSQPEKMLRTCRKTLYLYGD